MNKFDTFEGFRPGNHGGGVGQGGGDTEVTSPSTFTNRHYSLAADYVPTMVEMRRSLLTPAVQNERF